MAESLKGWITFRTWNWCVDVTSVRRLSEWMSCLLYAVVTKNMHGIQKPINCISLLHSLGWKVAQKYFLWKLVTSWEERELQSQVICSLLQPKREKIWQHLIIFSDYTIPSLNDNYFLWMLISFPAVLAVNRSVVIALGFIIIAEHEKSCLHQINWAAIVIMLYIYW